MGLPDDEELRSLFGYITSTLKEVEDVTLSIANRLYVKKTGTLKSAIKKDAEEIFESGLEQLDFAQSKDAADVMNAWVATQTDNIIPSIVSPDWLHEDTSLVMINAIYFQGLWQSPFLKGSTSDRTIHVDNTTEIKVPMMKSKAQFRYKQSRELKAKILQMYYQGHKASMIFVLPHDIEGLSGAMEQLKNHDLMAEVEDLETMLVDVVIPKFKVGTEIDLKELLPLMGITKIFVERQYDVRLLTSNERSYVSIAVQKAVIEVDEAGTKAAAVAVHARRRPMARKIREFVADRPFLFLLTFRNIPLFLGVYKGIKSAGPDVPNLEEPEPNAIDVTDIIAS